MMMQSSCKRVIVFDLDDTLYKEIDYLKSGYRAIAQMLVDELHLSESPYEKMLQWYSAGENAFQLLCSEYPKITIEECLNIYRTHYPDISLDDSIHDTLHQLVSEGCILCIITDGREITQKNKIKVLGLDKLISWDNIVISESFGSEKPCEANYRYFMNRYPNTNYTYVGDNVNKDFIAPNRLGWDTICLLDDGRNIHKQEFVDGGKCPKYRILSLSDLRDIFNLYYDSVNRQEYLVH